jgi:type IV pilus assembly protein PilV
MQSLFIHRQRGITLIESLVAIVVAALGILGILGVQMRTLTDTSTTVRRAQAVRLIEDLGERLKVNPNALGNINNYAVGWRSGAAPTAQASKLCDTGTCTHAEFAAYDVREWKRAVERALPLGNASIFFAPGDNTVGNRRQLGVLISWRENERDTSSAYKDSLSTTSAALGGDGTVATTCPTDFTCHLQYIPVSSRCAPYFADTAVQYFCPGPKS